MTKATRVWFPTSPVSCAFDIPRPASATVEVLEGKAADGKVRRAALARARKEILFAYAYPRLDVEVSKKRNHLLKAPFCVHPKTGKARAPVANPVSRSNSNSRSTPRDGRDDHLPSACCSVGCAIEPACWWS